MTTSQKRLRFDNVEESDEPGGAHLLRLTFSIGDQVIEESAAYTGERAGAP